MKEGRSRKNKMETDFKGKEKKKRKEKEGRGLILWKELADLSCASEMPTIIIHVFNLNYHIKRRYEERYRMTKKLWLWDSVEFYTDVHLIVPRQDSDPENKKRYQYINSMEN